MYPNLLYLAALCNASYSQRTRGCWSMPRAVFECCQVIKLPGIYHNHQHLTCVSKDVPVNLSGTRPETNHNNSDLCWKFIACSLISKSRKRNAVVTNVCHFVSVKVLRLCPFVNAFYFINVLYLRFTYLCIYSVIHRADSTYLRCD
jgi:hypothetical protein